MIKDSYLDKGKDLKDFESYWRKYKEEVFKKAAYITGNFETAEDITQDVYLKLFNEPPKHNDVKPWLLRVAINLAYNFVRNKKTHTEKNKLIEENENVISIEDVAIKNYEIRQTKKILNMLNPKERMCLLLKFSGYRYFEISEIVGIEKNSVGQTIARAQKKFQEKYKKGGF